MTRIHPAVAAFAALVMLILPLPAAATGLALTPTDRAALELVDGYMRSIETMRSRFIQVTSTGYASKGTIYMARPGRMRIEYDPPEPSLILADGEFFTYFDPDTGQATHIYLHLTPAALLLDKDLSLTSDNISVVGFERSPGVVRVTATRTDSPDEGKITLVFNEKPLILRKWTVIDAQGITTDVALIGAEFGVPLDDKIFTYEAPAADHGGN